jgi:hypothetical protein
MCRRIGDGLFAVTGVFFSESIITLMICVIIASDLAPFKSSPPKV